MKQYLSLEIPYPFFPLLRDILHAIWEFTFNMFGFIYYLFNAYSSFDRYQTQSSASLVWGNVGETRPSCNDKHVLKKKRYVIPVVRFQTTKYRLQAIRGLF